MRHDLREGLAHGVEGVVLLQRVWGLECSRQPGAVRTFVKNLRRKLGSDADTPVYIFTEPGVGYRMPKGRERRGLRTVSGRAVGARCRPLLPSNPW